MISKPKVLKLKKAIAIRKAKRLKKEKKNAPNRFKKFTQINT